MSWGAYVDTLKAYSRDASGSEHITEGGLIAFEGGANWTPDKLKISPAEGAAIAKCFKSKDFTTFQASGVRINEVKYQFLRAEDGKIVMAKKKDAGCVTLQATKQTVVIGLGAEGKQQGNVNKGVAQLAEYLESVGY